ncbi:GntR family transcriptional regulator [Rhodococcus sp. HNM0569]|uniref:GntR family transcriptional regulator n=1 Tax=Rhodococcus sp. HNM0569 TaxID=2716340 RepID=UPI00146E83FB|nr:GntR family transcriptional regulator [Rhodococcus sp. HNM0569]NLU81718.1 GntR family transcriptional regulator [Rhodococcus sp. HNM0569]
MTSPPTSRSGRGRPDRDGPLRRRPQLSDDVAVHVRNRIMSGDVRPGEFIRLDETAAALGVSVTPVREALLTLRGEGMVELVPHRGYVVAPLTRADVADLFWLQSIIAEELARRAARTADLATLAELHAHNADLAAAVAAGDAARIETAEFAFHRVVNSAAESRKLAWFLHGAVRYTPVHFYSGDPEWGKSAVASHERLIVALGAHDEPAAGTENKEHFEDGAVRLLAHLESIGMWS